MKSSFLLGVAGFIVVYGLAIGGILASLACHEWLTPQVDAMKVVWFWLGMAPFHWVLTRTLHDQALCIGVYLGMLPMLLIGDAAIRLFFNGQIVWGILMFGLLVAFQLGGGVCVLRRMMLTNFVR